MQHTDSENLAKKTVSDKKLKDRAYEIAINPKYNRYQSGLASMVFIVFEKKQDREQKQVSMNSHSKNTQTSN